MHAQQVPVRVVLSQTQHGQEQCRPVQDSAASSNLITILNRQNLSHQNHIYADQAATIVFIAT